MPSTIRGEALLATTGLTAALRPGPISITVKVLRKAEGISTQIQRRARRFVRSAANKLLADDAPWQWNYAELMALLPGAESEARNVENVSGFYDPALAEEFATALGTAVGYVQSIAPSHTLPALVGAKTLAPSGLDIGEFRRRYEIVDGPLRALDDLAATTLVPDQVEALSSVFPQLYALMRQALEQELVAYGAERPAWELCYAKDNALQIFLATSTMNPALAAELGKVFSDARERESGLSSQSTPAETRQKMSTKQAQTQQQRLEDRG